MANSDRICNLDGVTTMSRWRRKKDGVEVWVTNLLHDGYIEWDAVASGNYGYCSSARFVKTYEHVSERV